MTDKDNPADRGWEEDHSDDLGARFRQAMRGMAASVTIVTTKSDGRRYGMTATAVTSVSMDPPSLLVVVNKAASIHAPAQHEKRLCVNILSSDHDGFCATFSGAKQGEDRFADAQWTEHSGLPCLVGAHANIFCEIEKQIEYGTHTIFLGRVTHARQMSDREPLVYLDGSFVQPAATA